MERRAIADLAGLDAAGVNRAALAEGLALVDIQKA